jgi:hypothetical protein
MSKMPSGHRSPEMVDTTAILGAFQLSDRCGLPDENVPRHGDQRQERGLCNLARSSAAHQSVFVMDLM